MTVLTGHCLSQTDRLPLACKGLHLFNQRLAGVAREHEVGSQWGALQQPLQQPCRFRGYSIKLNPATVLQYDLYMSVLLKHLIAQPGWPYPNWPPGMALGMSSPLGGSCRWFGKALVALIQGHVSDHTSNRTGRWGPVQGMLSGTNELTQTDTAGVS